MFNKLKWDTDKENVFSNSPVSLEISATVSSVNPPGKNFSVIVFLAFCAETHRVGQGIQLHVACCTK